MDCRRAQAVRFCDQRSMTSRAPRRHPVHCIGLQNGASDTSRRDEVPTSAQPRRHVEGLRCRSSAGRETRTPRSDIESLAHRFVARSRHVSTETYPVHRTVRLRGGGGACALVPVVTRLTGSLYRSGRSTQHATRRSTCFGSVPGIGSDLDRRSSVHEVRTDRRGDRFHRESVRFVRWSWRSMSRGHRRASPGEADGTSAHLRVVAERSTSRICGTSQGGTDDEDGRERAHPRVAGADAAGLHAARR